jgi:hypothetical protein
MSIARSLRGALLAAFVVPFVALPALADLAAWDQARATGIAKQLADATDAFEQAVRKEPGLGDVGSGSAESGFGVGQKARVLKEQSRMLAGHLEKGKGHDDTKNAWRGLKEVADDVTEDAQKNELSEPTLDAWAKVADLMRQLAPYYDAKALTP